MHSESPDATAPDRHPGRLVGSIFLLLVQAFVAWFAAFWVILYQMTWNACIPNPDACIPELSFYSVWLTLIGAAAAFLAALIAIVVRHYRGLSSWKAPMLGIVATVAVSIGSFALVDFGTAGAGQ